MVDEYVNKLSERARHLEGRARTINKTQRELARKQRVLHQSSQEILYAIRNDLALLDEETSQLANKVKKLIVSLRRVAMQEQLRTIEQRSDTLVIDRWVSKKEAKKIVGQEIISSSYDEQAHQ